MTAKKDHSAIREQAIALRLAGKSLREIKAVLGPISNQTLNEALRGTPPPDWTRRPKAKDDLHAQARELRAQGLKYPEIAARLKVSKSSVSLWVRDVPHPPRDPQVAYTEGRRLAAEGVRKYWSARREASETQRAAQVSSAGAEVGELTQREILIAGAIAYWCEGCKTKPGRTGDRISFINSDPALITFFLRFLDAARAPRDDLVFRVYIHENADIEAAQRFWMEVSGAEPAQFRSPTLKRHNPKTLRSNTGEDYHGCLRIDVRRSSEIYRRVEGWVSAITATPEAGWLSNHALRNP